VSVAFTVKEILHNRVRDLLHLETGPGLGCTEPAAIGLGAAAAASLLNAPEPDAIEVTLDPNLYKNALRVIIPGSGGQCGLELAAALGAVAGDPRLRLQVFSRVDPEAMGRAQALLQANKVRVNLKEGHQGIYVKTVITAGPRTAAALISGRHDHLESLTLDGQPQETHPLLSRSGRGDENLEALEGWLTSLSLAEMVHLLKSLDADDLAYIRTGLDMNERLVAYGLKHGPGLGVAQAQQRLVHRGLLKPDMALTAGMLTAAGIDARMGGVMLPAMTLAGSGNHGIAAGIPIVAAAGFAKAHEGREILHAVTLSYLVTCAIKAMTGRLSAMCGCAVGGGAGVAAGVAYLMGGTVEHIGGAVVNHLESTATMICDGAKTGCALKVGEAVGTAVKSALLSLEGAVVRPQDGFIGKSPEATLRHLGALSRRGLAAMDPVILDIMQRQCR
jgi:L-cysteine desulfidase